MKYTKKYIYKQKKKQTRKRKYKQKHTRTHKRKGLKKQKRTRRKRGGIWPFSNKNTDDNNDNITTGTTRWAKYPDTSENLKGITPNNGPVVVLSSHQSRLLCELRGLGFLNKYNNKEIRFKNGAVLKFMIRKKAKDSNCTCAVDLVHDGELSNEGEELKGDYKKLLEGTKPYFVKEQPTGDRIKEIYGSYKFIPEVNVIANEKLGITTNDEFNLDIFLIRHGEGTHNVTKMKVLHTSAGLTQNGEVQAKHTGEALTQIIPNFRELHDKNLLYLCASDIKRAIQTMTIVKEKLSMPDKHIYVIPCSHEISAKKPPCDGSDSKVGLSSRGENEGASNDYLTKANVNIDMYKEFYKGIRRDHKTGIKRQHCVDTTMFKQIIKMVQKTDEEDSESKPLENEENLGSQPREEDGDSGSQPREEDGDSGSQSRENEENLG